MPGSDREVFDLFRTSGTAVLEVRYLAYALYTFEKSEWADHFTKRNGRSPAPDDVDAWIANLSDHRFEDLRRQAVDLFDLAARNYLRDEMEAADERALGSAIVAQVKSAGSFWKQLGLALITAIVAPILLGASSSAQNTGAPHRRRPTSPGRLSRQRRLRLRRPSRSPATASCPALAAFATPDLRAIHAT